MIRILKHDDYKYPLEKSKKTLDTPRPSPVLLDIIEEQELEAARELMEREAEATLKASVSASADDESDRCVLLFFYCIFFTDSAAILCFIS